MQNKNSINQLEKSLKEITESFENEVNKVRWNNNIPSGLELEDLQERMRYFRSLGNQATETIQSIGKRSTSDSEALLEKCKASYNYLARIFTEEIRIKTFEEDDDYWVNPC
jgi:hypothetical protein